MGQQHEIPLLDILLQAVRFGYSSFSPIPPRHRSNGQGASTRPSGVTIEYGVPDIHGASGKLQHPSPVFSGRVTVQQAVGHDQRRLLDDQSPSERSCTRNES